MGVGVVYIAELRMFSEGNSKSFTVCFSGFSLFDGLRVAVDTQTH